MNQLFLNHLLPQDTWLSIDPGNTESGWVICREDLAEMGQVQIVAKGIAANKKLRRAMYHSRGRHGHCLLLIECPKPRGRPTASEEMETLIEIGRILQMWRGPWSYVFRQPVKVGLTGLANAKDSHVSQALKDRFGGEAIAVGGKRCKKCAGKAWRGREHDPCEACDATGWHENHPPGPLCGVKDHIWAALALACWWQDTLERLLIHEIAGKQPKKGSVKT